MAPGIRVDGNFGYDISSRGDMLRLALTPEWPEAYAQASSWLPISIVESIDRTLARSPIYRNQRFDLLAEVKSEAPDLLDLWPEDTLLQIQQILDNDPSSKKPINLRMLLAVNPRLVGKDAIEFFRMIDDDPSIPSVALRLFFLINPSTPTSFFDLQEEKFTNFMGRTMRIKKVWFDHFFDDIENHIDDTGFTKTFRQVPEAPLQYVDWVSEILAELGYEEESSRIKTIRNAWETSLTSGDKNNVKNLVLTTMRVQFHNEHWNNLMDAFSKALYHNGPWGEIIYNTLVELDSVTSFDPFEENIARLMGWIRRLEQKIGAPPALYLFDAIL